MSDLICRQAAIDKLNERQRKLIYCFGFENDAVKIMDIAKSIIIAMPSAQPERPEQPESAREYCAECDHIEMCRWYPYEGCEFRSLPSAQLAQDLHSACTDTVSIATAIDAIEVLLEQSEDDEHDKTWNNAIRGSINAVKHHVPSAQSELIHCRDCKWHNEEINQCNVQICASMRGEDFCSRAERRTE